jgi:hypothetical protein
MNAEADAIRESIGQEQYREALAQWTAYTRRIQRAMESGTLSPEQMNELRDLFQWARAVLLSARAHLQDRYYELELAAAYVGRAPRPARVPLDPLSA